MSSVACNVANLTLVATTIFADIAYAQKPQLPGNYPNKPIRVIVAAAPGGGTDILARLIIAGKLGERWNQSFVIEARSGASGTIAADMVVKAPATGYTLLAAPMSTLVTVPLINKVSYDAHKDLDPIAQFVSQPSVLVVSTSVPVNSVKELVAHAKSKPGTLNAAVTGIGTSTHLTMELFKSMAGISLTNVSYKGTGETMIALLGGHVHLLFGSAPGVMPHAKSGKIRMLAVTSLQRAQFLPDLPTISESGVPGFEVVGWYGLLAPAGTPRAITAALNTEINEILSLPDIREKLAADGADAAPGSPAQFRDVIARETEKWKKLLKESNLKL